MTDTLVQGLASLLGGKVSGEVIIFIISRPLECSDPASHSHLRDWKPAPDSIHPAAH